MIYFNRQAKFDYNLIEYFTCGVILEGWEVKSLDATHGDITIGYITIQNNKLILHNVKISPMKIHNVKNDLEKRDRILLVNKSELNKIQKFLEIKGYTTLPIKLYRNEKHLWKLDIAVGTGKNKQDKRQYLKEKDSKKELRNI
jgi:SsrA-binding protein